MVAANMPHPITWEQLREAVAKDKVMTMLAEQVSSGFPPDKKLLRLELREYYQHRDVLSQIDGVPLYKDRVIIPAALRGAVLETLHSAHQGITGMTERAMCGGQASHLRLRRHGTDARTVLSMLQHSPVLHHNHCPSLTTLFSTWCLTTSSKVDNTTWWWLIGLVDGQQFSSVVDLQLLLPSWLKT